MVLLQGKTEDACKKTFMAATYGRVPVSRVCLSNQSDGIPIMAMKKNEGVNLKCSCEIESVKELWDAAVRGTSLRVRPRYETDVLTEFPARLNCVPRPRTNRLVALVNDPDIR